MSTLHTVVLVDDHPAFRLGVRQVIASDPQFRVVGEASDGQAALELIRRVRPDLAVVDINLPKLSGLELVRQHWSGTPPHPRRRADHVSAGELVSGSDGPGRGRVCAQGKRGGRHPALFAGSGEGGCYLSPSLSGLLLRQRQSQQNLRHQTPGLDDLTPMERRILKLIAENKTSKQIGTEFFISPRTVETHRRNICLKLGLSGSHPLLQFALETGPRSEASHETRGARTILSAFGGPAEEADKNVRAPIRQLAGPSHRHSPPLPRCLNRFSPCVIPRRKIPPSTQPKIRGRTDSQNPRR